MGAAIVGLIFLVFLVVDFSTPRKDGFVYFPPSEELVQAHQRFTSKFKSLPKVELRMAHGTGANARVSVAQVSPRLYRLVVWERTLEIMTEEELFSILGHEYSHILNDDLEFKITIYSVEKELAADTGSIKLMKQMGLNPCALASALRKLQENNEDRDPSIPERIEAVLKHCQGV